MKNTGKPNKSDIATLNAFIGRQQQKCILDALKGEEKAWFVDKMRDLLTLFTDMPETYGQDGLGDNAIAYLHYFTSGWDWYITERDGSVEQHQAFGLACGHCDELGYISIADIISEGAELDLHWKPKTLGAVRS